MLALLQTRHPRNHYLAHNAFAASTATPNASIWKMAVDMR